MVVVTLYQGGLGRHSGGESSCRGRGGLCPEDRLPSSVLPSLGLWVSPSALSVPPSGLLCGWVGTWNCAPQTSP